MKSLTAGFLFLAAGSANGAVTIYTDEAAYLADLAALGQTVISEGFETEGIWAISRGSPIAPASVSSVSSQGLLWQSNRPGNGVGTDNFLGHSSSSYRFYSNPHGKTFDRNMQNGCDAAAEQDSVPEACWQNDGWRIQAAQAGATLYGVGGWFYSASGAAKITYLLDGLDIIPDNANRDGHKIGIDWSFFGVIDTTGFLMAEIREMGGKAKEGQYFYGDSFTVSISADTPAPDSTEDKQPDDSP